MRSMFLLLLVGLPLAANCLVAQPPLHEGDQVRLLRVPPEDRYRMNVGIVQAFGPDSATVMFKYGCGDSRERTVAQSELAIRVAKGRLTIPFAIGGAVNAFFWGKIAAHVVAHNGGGPEGARAARDGVALLIPYSAIKGFEKRTPGWIPLSEQTRHTEHLHVMPGDDYLNRTCPLRRPPVR